jgi:hypothetical protein
MLSPLGTMFDRKQIYTSRLMRSYGQFTYHPCLICVHHVPVTEVREGKSKLGEVAKS